MAQPRVHFNRGSSASAVEAIERRGFMPHIFRAVWIGVESNGSPTPTRGGQRLMARPRLGTAARLLAFALTLFAGGAPGTAETFDRGKASYRTTGGTWAKASIEVSKGKLEIHSPRGPRGQLVGRFELDGSEDGTESVSLERYVGVRRRTGAGVKAGIIGGGIVGGLWAGLKPALTKIARSKGARQGDIQQVEEEYWDRYATMVFGGALGVVAAVAIVKGLRKAEGDPHWRVSGLSDQGTRSLEIRVSRMDIARFEQALMNNRLNDDLGDDAPEDSAALSPPQR